jgi:5-hydroxyisourate hydrolase
VSAITTHILDVSSGRPARGVRVALEQRSTDGSWVSIGTQTTDDDGRARDLIAPGTSLSEGDYRLKFDVGAYFTDRETDAFYDEIAIAFKVRDASQHYHVPLLLSPFGYSTYRGS